MNPFEALGVSHEIPETPIDAMGIVRTSPHTRRVSRLDLLLNSEDRAIGILRRGQWDSTFEGLEKNVMSFVRYNQSYRSPSFVRMRVGSFSHPSKRWVALESNENTGLVFVGDSALRRTAIIPYVVSPQGLYPRIESARSLRNSRVVPYWGRSSFFRALKPMNVSWCSSESWEAVFSASVLPLKVLSRAIRPIFFPEWRFRSGPDLQRIFEPITEQHPDFGNVVRLGDIVRFVDETTFIGAGGVDRLESLLIGSGAAFFSRINRRLPDFHVMSPSPALAARV